MLDDVTRKLFAREAAALADPLYNFFDAAITETKKLPFSEDDYPHLHAHHRRAVLRTKLEERPLPNGWKVTGNSRQSGQTILHHPSHGATLRILSESTVTSNGVPHAGHTQSRQNMWRQLSLFDDETITGRDLLLLTDVRKATPTLRIVRPVEAGRYKGKVRCDFAIPMLREIDIMKNAAFDSSAEYYNFFVDLEDEGTGDV